MAVSPLGHLYVSSYARSLFRRFEEFALGRDKDDIALNKQLTVDMMVGGSIVRSVPSELKP